MLAGIFDLAPSSAMTYSATTRPEPYSSSPNSVRRFGFGPQT